MVNEFSLGLGSADPRRRRHSRGKGMGGNWREQYGGGIDRGLGPASATSIPTPGAITQGKFNRSGSYIGQATFDPVDPGGGVAPPPDDNGDTAPVAPRDPSQLSPEEWARVREWLRSIYDTMAQFAQTMGVLRQIGGKWFWYGWKGDPSTASFPELTQTLDPAANQSFTTMYEVGTDHYAWFNAQILNLMGRPPIGGGGITPAGVGYVDDWYKHGIPQRITDPEIPQTLQVILNCLTAALAEWFSRLQGMFTGKTWDQHRQDIMAEFLHDWTSLQPGVGVSYKDRMRFAVMEVYLAAFRKAWRDFSALNTATEALWSDMVSGTHNQRFQGMGHVMEIIVRHPSATPLPGVEFFAPIPTTQAQAASPNRKWQPWPLTQEQAEQGKPNNFSWGMPGMLTFRSLVQRDTTADATQAPYRNPLSLALNSNVWNAVAPQWNTGQVIGTQQTGSLEALIAAFYNFMGGLQTNTQQSMSHLMGSPPTHRGILSLLGVVLQAASTHLQARWVGLRAVEGKLKAIKAYFENIYANVRERYDMEVRLTAANWISKPLALPWHDKATNHVWDTAWFALHSQQLVPFANWGNYLSGQAVKANSSWTHVVSKYDDYHQWATAWQGDPPLPVWEPVAYYPDVKVEPVYPEGLLPGSQYQFPGSGVDPGDGNGTTVPPGGMPAYTPAPGGGQWLSEPYPDRPHQGWAVYRTNEGQFYFWRPAGQSPDGKVWDPYTYNMTDVVQDPPIGGPIKGGAAVVVEGEKPLNKLVPFGWIYIPEYDMAYPIVGQTRQMKERTGDGWAGLGQIPTGGKHFIGRYQYQADSGPGYPNLMAAIEKFWADHMTSPLSVAGLDNIGRLTPDRANPVQKVYLVQHNYDAPNSPGLVTYDQQGNEVPAPTSWWLYSLANPPKVGQQIDMRQEMFDYPLGAQQQYASEGHMGPGRKVVSVEVLPRIDPDPNHPSQLAGVDWLKARVMELYKVGPPPIFTQPTPAAPPVTAPVQIQAFKPKAIEPWRKAANWFVLFTLLGVTAMAGPGLVRTAKGVKGTFFKRTPSNNVVRWW